MNDGWHHENQDTHCLWLVVAFFLLPIAYELIPYLLGWFVDFAVFAGA